jgi:hypothetical protein
MRGGREEACFFICGIRENPSPYFKADPKEVGQPPPIPPSLLLYLLYNYIYIPYYILYIYIINNYLIIYYKSNKEREGGAGVGGPPGV